MSDPLSSVQMGGCDPLDTHRPQDFWGSFPLTKGQQKRGELLNVIFPFFFLFSSSTRVTNKSGRDRKTNNSNVKNLFSLIYRSDVRRI